MKKSLISFCVAALALLSACFSTHRPPEDTSYEEEIEGVSLLKDYPRPGYMTVMSRWIDGDYPPAAIVFRFEEDGEVMEIAHRKGNKNLWKPMLDWFYRSADAYFIIAGLIEKIPDKFDDREILEAELFSYLPFTYLKHRTSYGRTEYGLLPAYCLKHSSEWQKNLHNDRLIVVDKHGPDSTVREGYVLEFATNGNKDSYLHRIHKLREESSTLYYTFHGHQSPRNNRD